MISMIHSTPIYTVNRNDLTTNGLTAVACEFKNGGYVKIGNLVLVEIRIVVTSNVADWGNIITGLPSTRGMEVPVIAIDTTGVKHSLDISGTALRRYPNDETIINRTINIFGCYVSL